MSTITDDTTAVSATLASIAAGKVAMTTMLNTVINQFNSLPPSAAKNKMATDFIAYVVQYNAISALQRTLATQFSQLETDVAAQTISLANLTDAQVEEMKTNPQQYFAAGYLALTNSMLFYNRGDGLMLIEAVHSDLLTDHANAWADFDAGVTPVIQRTAIVYESGHALDLVSKALLDATSATS